MFHETIFRRRARIPRERYPIWPSGIIFHQPIDFPEKCPKIVSYEIGEVAIINDQIPCKIKKHPTNPRAHQYTTPVEVV